MNKLTYRAQKNLRLFGITAGCLLLAGTVVWLCWLIWVERFIVYSDRDAHLDFSWQKADDAVEATYVPPESVAVQIVDSRQEENLTLPLGQINGVYVTTSDWISGVDRVEQALKSLAPGSVVMLDMKSIYGNFYYSSDLAEGAIATQIDTEAVDRLLEALAKTDYYTIARVPAFRDRAYGLNHTSHGLAVSSGKHLWYDEQNCYWLNPIHQGTLDHLTQIANELKALGFDEVVFTEFRFPDTEDIIFESSLTRAEALAQAAQTLVSNCADDRFAVSFETDDLGFALPQGRSRLYVTGIDAAQTDTTAAAVTVTDPAANLVFVTESNDTRFDAYSVLRPILLGE